MTTLIDDVPRPEPGEAESPLSARARAVAVWHGRRTLMPVETCAASLPVPWRSEDGGLRFRVMLFPCGNDDETGDYYYYAPEIRVTVDAETLEVVGDERLREREPREEPLCYRHSSAVRGTPFEDVDRLHEELLQLYGPIVEWMDLDRLEDDEREVCRRFEALFRFLVNAPLFPHYESLNPAFFAWLDRQAGAGERRRLAPEADPEIEPPVQSFPEAHDAAAIVRLTPPPGAPWTADTATLLRSLADAGLIPTRSSPLHGLELPEGDDGENVIGLFEWIPDEQVETWKSVLRTLCDPTVGIHQSYVDDVLALETRIFVSRDEIDEDGEAFWVRYTRDEEADEHAIAYSAYPERLRDVVLQGFLAREVRNARQIVHTFTIDEIVVLFGLADLKAGRGDLLLSVDRDALDEVWDAGGAGESPGWTLVSRMTSPVSLAEPPAVHVSRGLEQLESQGLARVEGPVVHVERGLRTVLSGIEPPRACTTLMIERIGEESSELEGFSAIRTATSIWVWELAKDLREDDAGGRTEVNFFPVTGGQLAAIYDDFLGIAPVGKEDGWTEEPA